MVLNWNHVADSVIVAPTYTIEMREAGQPCILASGPPALLTVATSDSAQAEFAFSPLTTTASVHLLGPSRSLSSAAQPGHIMPTRCYRGWRSVKTAK